jgi:hypothetical protein
LSDPGSGPLEAKKDTGTGSFYVSFLFFVGSRILDEKMIRYEMEKCSNPDP